MAIIDYGTADVSGQTYQLTGQADFTGRQLPEHMWEYTEFSAPGLDASGNSVTIRWFMKLEEEKELDDYDWNVADSVNYI